MRISDWSSDVCSSDLEKRRGILLTAVHIDLNQIESEAEFLEHQHDLLRIWRPAAVKLHPISSPNQCRSAMSVGEIFEDHVRGLLGGHDRRDVGSAANQRWNDPCVDDPKKSDERSVGKECVRTGRSRW